MSTSNVDIANIALRMLGEPSITSLTGTQRAQVLCAQALPNARKEVLAFQPWSIAVSRKTLSKLTEEENLTDFKYVYSLPADNLRVLSVHQVSEPSVSVYVKIEDMTHDRHGYGYIIEGGNIFTDVDNAYVRYIKDVENPASLPSYIIDAIAANIAKRISYSLVQNVQLSQSTMQMYFTALNLAMQLDGRQSVNTNNPPKQWGEIR